MSDFLLNSFNTLSHGLIGYIIPFLFVLSIVVFFHELGHFLVARWAGVKVLTFSLGFGPELARFNDRHGTRWKISAIPLGGYVKFFGDENAASVPNADTVAGMSAAERNESFYDMQRIVGANAGRTLEIVVERGGVQTTLRAAPALREVKDSFGNTHRIGVLGIS